jgi:hypothetical protein
MKNKKHHHARPNQLLREAGLGLCCMHGLAAVGVAGGGCRRRGFAGAEQVSPAQVQF